jgi:subtilisin family serine protease
MKRILALSVLALLMGLLPVASAAPAQAALPAGVPTHIVVLKSGSMMASAVDTAATTLARAYGLTVGEVYRYAIQGFAAIVPPGRLAALQRDPRVAYVEPNQVWTIQAQTTPTGISRTFAASNSKITINGVDDRRIDVDVAVIDTGISAHPDLNVAQRVNCVNAFFFIARCVSGGTDGNGHGTHVAGTIGALDNGVGVVGMAPGARLWSVRVLNDQGSGYTNQIIAGIDYVRANAASIEVANMSLGCECTSAAQNTAITNLVNAGVVVVVAAGNSHKDASTFSPANHPDVITVSALADFNGQPGGGAAPTCRTDQDDTLADFSNFGSQVEIAAPGVCIYSTWLNGGYNTISGTSMASPHVAGAAALLASMHNPNSRTDVLNIRAALMQYGNLNWTDDSGDGIKERLLDVSNTSVFNPVTVAGPG